MIDFLILSKPYENDIGIEYAIKYSDDIADGEAHLIFSEINTYPIAMDVFPELRCSDKLVEISIFYPHGSSDKERIKNYSKKGIGTTLLENMIQDSKENGSRVMFINTAYPKMQSLIEKHDFVKDAYFDSCYFKLL